MSRFNRFNLGIVAIVLLLSTLNFAPAKMKVTLEEVHELSAQLKGYRFVHQGRVVDQRTDEPIPNARVHVAAYETFTDAQGSFTVTLTINNEIKITADGYEPYGIIMNIDVE